MSDRTLWLLLLIRVPILAGGFALLADRNWLGVLALVGVTLLLRLAYEVHLRLKHG